MTILKKLITMPFLVLLLGVVLTACGTTNQSNDNNTDNSKKETTEAADQNKENASDEKTEDKSASEKTDDQSKETAAKTEDQAGQSNEDAKESSSKEITKEEPAKDQSKAESTTKKEVTKEGTYVGLADGHTIAVNIDGKEVAIQFGNTFSKQVNSLKEESKVKVTYTKDANGTLRLKTIESVKAK
ncbi:hypothetical protein I5506_06445 [Bacillus pumilus]|nr:hypothetical protein [Bacillus pumilus]MCC9088362.1 hypothetical protein [Bacillus pumilus]MED1747397.1 hypothetical protein [Bacillus zhangzhouensis]UUD42287.1 hypothetical protein NPA43_16010 [Bacillus pumilus]